MKDLSDNETILNGLDVITDTMPPTLRSEAGSLKKLPVVPKDWKTVPPAI